MRVAICHRRGRRDYAEIVEDSIKDLVEVVSIDDVWSFKEVEVDLYIAVGGDGTVIRCSKIVLDSAPIVGIKAGRLGFLSSYTIDDLEEFADDLKRWSFVEERRMMIEAVAGGKKELALNDVVVQKDVDGRMLEVEVEVNGESPLWFFSDGLIVSTPTGSTAYNLSAGGPVVYPFSETMQITPILPHFLFNRGIVVPSNAIVKITLDTDANLLVDGKLLGKFRSLEVKRSEKYVRTLRSPKMDFFGVIAERIGFGRRVLK